MFVVAGVLGGEVALVCDWLNSRCLQVALTCWMKADRWCPRGGVVEGRVWRMRCVGVVGV